MGGSAGVFADMGRGLSFECRKSGKGPLLGKAGEPFSGNFLEIWKKSIWRKELSPPQNNNIHFTDYLELVQHIKYLAVFQFKSPTALTIAPSFLWSLSTLIPN